MEVGDSPTGLDQVALNDSAKAARSRNSRSMWAARLIGLGLTTVGAAAKMTTSAINRSTMSSARSESRPKVDVMKSLRLDARGRCPSGTPSG